MARPGEDLTGQKFGRLTAVKNLGRATGKTIWLFSCECGNEVERWPPNVKGGSTSSCGCIRVEEMQGRATHGCSRRGNMDASYSVWNMMLQRCGNNKNTNYQNYGGRGITVCERWLKFENFLEDMGKKPEGMSIDRIDVNGNYEPGNCRWATMEEQNNNKRNSVHIEHDGRILTVGQWAKIAGVARGVFNRRLSQGMNVGEILESFKPK